MRKVVLKWFGPYAICDLLDAFKIDEQNRSPSFSEQKFPVLKEKRVYMYLRPDLSTVTYIGKSRSTGTWLNRKNVKRNPETPNPHFEIRSLAELVDILM